MARLIFPIYSELCTFLRLLVLPFASAGWLIASLMLQLCYAQTSLPGEDSTNFLCADFHCDFSDSLGIDFDMDCIQQRVESNSDLCCIQSEGSSSFCPLQCLNPEPNECICLNPFSPTEPSIFPPFPRPDISDPNAIDCIDIFPPTAPPTTGETCSHALALY